MFFFARLAAWIPLASLAGILLVVAWNTSELILRMREVLALDATGLRALEDLLDKTRRDGTALVLPGVHAQPLIAMGRSGLLERVGSANAVDDVGAALARARELLAGATERAAPPPA